MAPDELLGDPERPTDTAHLVLEEQAQRFDDPEVHLSGSPPTLWCDLIVAEGR